MLNYDVKKDMRNLYAAKKRFEVVDVPAMKFLMADGEGSPNTSSHYKEVVQALYSTAYAVRALAIEELGKKHTVGPLEGLWWADDMNAIEKHDLAAGDRIRFEEFHEGKAVQAIHVGPYHEEGPTIARMHDEFMSEQGLRPRGSHHEIYLSDVRRVDPSRLRTILGSPWSPCRTRPSTCMTSRDSTALQVLPRWRSSPAR